MFKSIWRYISKLLRIDTGPRTHTPGQEQVPKYKCILAEGALPESLESTALYIITEDGVPWEAVMLCPSGCGTRLEMNLLPDERPRWRYSVKKGLPSLHPSVNRRIGCKAHFWLRRGQIVWASSFEEGA